MNGSQNLRFSIVFREFLGSQLIPMHFRFIFGENKCVKTHFPDFRSLANIAINPSFSKVSEREQISDSGNAVLQGFTMGFDENADFQKGSKHSCRPTFIDSGPRRVSENV